MSEDIYFEAKHKFRQPFKYKKSTYKPLGKEYKFIDPLESFIQQVETKIVKPKRATRVKQDMIDVDKNLAKLLKKRRKMRKAREVGKTVDPNQLKRIQALKERATLPSVTLQKEREDKEREDKEKAETELTMNPKDETTLNYLLDLGLSRDDAIKYILNYYKSKEQEQEEQEQEEEEQEQEQEEQEQEQEEQEQEPISAEEIAQKARKEGVYMPKIHKPRPASSLENHKDRIQQLNLISHPDLIKALDKWHLQTYKVGLNVDEFNPVEFPNESEDDYKERIRNALTKYNVFRKESKARAQKTKTGKGFTFKPLHPHLLGSLYSHHYIHTNANKILATLPAKHKGIKELEELKKNAKRGVVMSNKVYGKGFGDFFKKMVNAGQTLKDVYSKIPDVIKKPLEERAKEAGRQQVQKASLFLQDKFNKK